MLYSPSKSLKFGGIKNVRLEVVRIPPNPSSSSLKKTFKQVNLIYFTLSYSQSIQTSF